MNEKALIRALQELLRTVTLAVIPILVDSLNKGFIDWRVIAVVAAISALRFIEKYIYENKATTDNPVTNFLRFE